MQLERFSLYIKTIKALRGVPSSILPIQALLLTHIVVQPEGDIPPIHAIYLLENITLSFQAGI